MTEIFEGRTSLPSSVAEKIMQADLYKTEGNTLYKQKEYRKAIGKYHRALLFIKSLQQKANPLTQMLQISDQFVISDEMKEKMRIIEIGCYNNLSVCLLQGTQPNYDRIIEYSKFVTELDKKNVKAFYRQGLAYYYKHNFMASLESFNQAKQHSQGIIDPGIKKYIAKCESQLANQEEKTKKMYKNMFGKMSNGSACSS
ncbi:tetratricopeptide repeat protein 9C-like [Antedon mediterranea]|uniref:tetratricopeptide repeat protein 9C-like n=1 Tax=Antedon mediterranea TaxID=105859 RepID=UPI003AF701C0